MKQSQISCSLALTWQALSARTDLLPRSIDDRVVPANLNAKVACSSSSKRPFTILPTSSPSRKRASKDDSHRFQMVLIRSPEIVNPVLSLLLYHRPLRNEPQTLLTPTKQPFDGTLLANACSLLEQKSFKAPSVLLYAADRELASCYGEIL